MSFRPWAGWDDLVPMQALLSEALRDTPTRAFIHPGDLAWSLGWSPRTTEELAVIARLWEVDGRIVAWAVDDGGYVSECVATAFEDDDLYAEMTAWIDGRLPQITRSVRGDDPVGIARLDAAGYRRVPTETMIAFSIDLGDIPAVEPDVRVSAVDPSDEIGARLSITHAAFGVDRPFEDYVAAYRRFMDSPAYPVGWDLVAWTPDAEAAACCIAWPDAASGVGNLEPVAAHPRFQRRGYASTVVRAGLRRLRDAGMRRAIVRTPSGNVAAAALYRSVGFARDHEQLDFRRPAGRAR
jgi:ribosomal protein S18 acetylase RimI-like enzyme